MQGELYPELFAPNEIPKRQDALASSKVVAEDAVEMAPFDRIMVAHNEATLTGYLEQLVALQDDPIAHLAIGLNAYEHGMALIREKGKWVLVNHDEITELHTNEDCARAIINGFSANKNAVFSMTFHSGLSGDHQEIKELNAEEEKKLLQRNELVDSKGVNLLSLASAREDTERLNYLLAQGVDVNGAGESPLLIAARLGNHELARLLLEQEADPNLANGEYETPLLKAVKKGDQTMVELLLKYQADVDQENDQEESPLVLAISRGHQVIAALLLKHNANLEPNCSNTPILKAIDNADDKMIRLLVKQGVDLNQPSSTLAITPLEQAIIKKNPELVNLLIDLGADPYLKIKNYNEQEETALNVLFSHYKRNDLLIIEDRILYAMMPKDEPSRRKILNQASEQFADEEQGIAFDSKEEFVNYYLQRLAMAEKYENKMLDKLVDEVLEDLGDLDGDNLVLSSAPGQSACESDKLSCQNLRKTLSALREAEHKQEEDGDSAHP